VSSTESNAQETEGTGSGLGREQNQAM